MISPYGDFSNFVLKHLRGEARYWFQLVSGNITDLERFNREFREQFHGNRYDNIAARELSTNNYWDFTHLSPCEYFVNIVSRAKDSTMKYHEEYICESMSRQFGETIE